MDNYSGATEMGTNTDEEKRCFEYPQSQWFSQDVPFPCIVYDMHLIRKLKIGSTAE